MIYLVVSKEVSNGFDYTTDIKSFTNKEVAEQQFAYEIKCLKDFYPEEVENTNINHFYFQDENNMKGNGHSVSLISEEEMMDKIISAVEASQDRDYWRYEGYDSSYVLEAKVLVLNDAPAVSWDLEPYNDETYRPYQVVKRPYDPEQPSGEDYIYDVRMWNDGSTFTDSLDCVGINILFTIYDCITE